MEIAGWDSRWLYAGLVGAVAVERGVELLVSRRNEAWLRERGAIEVGARHYPWMVGMHTAFLLSCPLEVWLLGRRTTLGLSAAMLGTLLVAQALRWWVVATLGRRWTTTVLCLPGTPPVRSGPFRLFRHPNYLAVAIEIVALPLVHGAWLTAAFFSVANALLMILRIPVEERGLREISGIVPGAGGER